MNEHLSQDQLISYVYHTLTDAQRETMNVHLGTCQECRARLSGHEALGRRVQYSVMDWRKGVSPSAHMTFAAVAPKLKRSRKVARVWTGSKQFVYGAATLALLAVLVVGLVLYFREIGQWNAGLVSETAMYGGGPQRTFVYEVKGPKRGELRWRFTTKGVIGSAPIVVDGVAYVGSYDGFLYAVDTQTSQEKWKFDAGRAVISTPAVAHGTVYFGSGCIGGGAQGCGDPPGSEYYFYALDRETGQERWRFKAGGAIVSSPLFADGVVYFGSEDQHLYALDARTGRERWRFKAEDALWSSPALANGLLYFGAGCVYCGPMDDTRLYAVDSQTGQEIWRFETGGWVESTPAIANGTVYFGSGDRHVYAVDGQTGQERWRFETGGELEASLAVDAGLVFAASKDQHLYALDSQSGQEVWKIETGGLIYGAPAVADGIVYFGSTDYYAYAVEGQTGRELWRLEIFATCSGSPVVEDGVVYFGGGNYLSAVGEPGQ